MGRRYDLLAAGELAAAKQRIQASMQDLDAAFHRAAALRPADARYDRVVTDLSRVLGLKAGAVSVLRPRTLALARQRLSQAMVIEEALLAWAAENGVPL